MDAKVERPLEDKHTWLFDTHAGFYFCQFCKVEVARMLFALEYDDREGQFDTGEILDSLVDVECE